MSNREPRWRGVGRARTSGAQVIDRVKVLREIAGIILGWTAPALTPNYLNSLKTPKLFANIAALFANKRELLAKNLALSIDKKQWLANKAALSANKRKLLAKNLALSTDKKQWLANHAALFANKGKLLAKNLALSTNKKQLLANQAALFSNNTGQWVEWARRAGRLE